MKRLIRNAIRTPDGSYLESSSTHDYRTHVDENGKTYSVDGGLSYVSRSAHGDEIDMCLYDDVPHSVQREVLKWGSYGKNGGQPLRRIPIACMDTSHITAVLNECKPSTVYRNCMELELKMRDLGEL